MRLHNTLNKKLEPIEKKDLKVYTCGPTVYDSAHIGNLSNYIFADTLWRVLSLNHVVTHVMNYTDVDDKTIRRSREKYPAEEPTKALEKLTDQYINLFLSDMKLVGNNIEHIKFMRATENIDEMKSLIKKLYEKGYAYTSDDGIYFSIDAYKKSGKKYGQLLKLNESNTSQARIQNDEYGKDSVHDFALWKKQKNNEPAWDFELNGQNLKGRPGWHIECSAMSQKALGIPFDIHTGGVDLIFPHHENEIAQSTAAEQSSEMASMFVHNEHMLIDGKKMAKSANNFYTLQDIIDKGYDPLAFRLLVLQSHYRSQAHFSWKNLEAAQNRLKAYQALADLRWQAKDISNPTGNMASYLAGSTEKIKKAFFDDLNTPQALRWISDSTDQVSILPQDNLSNFKQFIEFLDKILGLGFSKTIDLDLETKNMLSEREKARKRKDWAKSDELRDKLKERGIGLRDTEYGAIWYRL